MSEKVPPRVLFEFGSDEPELPPHLGGEEEEEFESYEDEEASSMTTEIEEIPEGLPEIVEKPNSVQQSFFDLPYLALMLAKVR